MTLFFPVAPNTFFLSPVFSSLELARRLQDKAGAAYWQGVVAGSLHSSVAVAHCGWGGKVDR